MATAKPKLSDELSQKRTDLSVQRTMMSADRSLMSWVRTGLSLIGFGFTIYAFLQSIAEKTQAIMSSATPRRIGMILLALGIISIVFGCLQDLATIKTIKKIHHVSAWRFSFIIAGIIGLLGVFLFVSLLLQVHLI